MIFKTLCSLKGNESNFSFFLFLLILSQHFVRKMSADQSNYCEVITSDLPSEFEFLEVLGEGSFGQVLKCS